MALVQEHAETRMKTGQERMPHVDYPVVIGIPQQRNPVRARHTGADVIHDRAAERRQDDDRQEQRDRQELHVQLGHLCTLSHRITRGSRR